VNAPKNAPRPSVNGRTAVAGRAAAAARVARVASQRAAAKPRTPAEGTASVRTYPVVVPVPEFQELSPAIVGELVLVKERWNHERQRWEFLAETTPDLRPATKRRTPWRMVEA
jgi:hypothetical protein